MSQLLPSDRFLPFWERYLGFVHFFNAEERRQKIALFADDPLAGEVEALGRHFARCIRRDRPKPNTKWHLDEAVIVIGGVRYWLWRAIDGDGDVLDILVRSRRNAKAARRFL